MFTFKPLYITFFSLSVFSMPAVYAESTTLQHMSDAQLAETTGQALMSLSYIGPTDVTNLESKRLGGDKNIGFYKLGLEADLAINANIKKLQLGCGGINGAGSCDIDIDNFSLSGNATTREGRASSDAILTNPFIEFAIRNPDSASQREIVGLRLSAEKAVGLLTFGTDNGITPNGINSLSGYMELASAKGNAMTQERTMDGATFGAMTGKVNVCLSGRICINNNPMSSTDYILQLRSAAASFVTDPAIVNGKRLSSVQLTGKADIAPIVFECATTAGCMKAKVTVFGFIPVNIQTSVIGKLNNLKANVQVNQSLGLIHNIPVNGNAFSLSLQQQDIQWTSAAVKAQRGWWMAFESPIDIGDISPLNKVAIPNSTLAQVLPSVNSALNSNPIVCQLTQCFSGMLTIPDLFLGPDSNRPNIPQTYVDFPLNNQVLSKQGFAPNCYGSLKFC